MAWAAKTCVRLPYILRSHACTPTSLVLLQPTCSWRTAEAPGGDKDSSLTEAGVAAAEALVRLGACLATSRAVPPAAEAANWKALPSKASHCCYRCCRCSLSCGAARSSLESFGFAVCAALCFTCRPRSLALCFAQPGAQILPHSCQAFLYAERLLEACLPAAQTGSQTPTPALQVKQLGGRCACVVSNRMLNRAACFGCLCWR